MVAEVLEGSVMLASQALLLFGVPLTRVIRRIQEARAHRYTVFNGYFRSQQPTVDIVESLQTRFQNVMLAEKDYAVGKTIDQLNFSELLIEVNSVRRHGVEGSPPSGDMILRAGDVLMLLGQPLPLEEAEKRLRQG